MSGRSFFRAEIVGDLLELTATDAPPVSVPIAQALAAPELLGACREVLGLLDAGLLVRDTSRDMEPGWAMQNLRLVLGLKRATDAIAKAEAAQ